MRSLPLDEIQDLVQGSVRTNVSGASITTFSIGGPLDLLVEPGDPGELQALLKLFKETNQKFSVIGFGSNLLIPDSGIRGWVIRLGKGFRYHRWLEHGHVTVGGAMSLMTLCRDSARQGLSGLEFAGGIPASLAGAVRMNAGAHGSDLAGIVEAVRIVDPGHGRLELSKRELEFGYRKSNLPPDSVLYEVDLKLVSSNPSDVQQALVKNLDYRRATQPLTHASAGSVFKNPESVNMSAGAVIESLGLKGKTIGGAQISDLHANWIISPKKKASSQDVLALIELCRKSAREQLSVELEPEIRVCGDQA